MLIAQTLARDGLLVCAAACLRILRDARPDADPGECCRVLRQAGLPTDLLACFRPEEGAPDDARSVVAWLLGRLEANPPISRAAAAGVPFVFRAAVSGFTAFPDSGQADPKVMRVQLTRPAYFAAKGDGGSFDLTRQMLELTDAKLLIHIEERHLSALRQQLANWPEEFVSRVTLLIQPLALSQWAQDSGKAGQTPDGRAATMTPRFASRGEEASQLVAGDSCIGDGLRAAGHVVVRSSLVFQGGNILTVLEPKGGRTLLVGEAEIYRNQPLGLTRDQVTQAFRGEFGAERCVVLPAASIHLDYEVSVRAHRGRVVAFVNDTVPAVHAIVRAGLGALARAGLVSADLRLAAAEGLRVNQPATALGVFLPALQAHAKGPGRFPVSLTQTFSDGPADSGVGNFLCFLAAIDALMALGPGTPPVPDPYLASYLESIRRQEQDRKVIRAQLRDLGWDVVPVPSLALGNRGINYLNGIHTPTTYLMPAWGGLFEPIDREAMQTIAAALDREVRVSPVFSAESQRRDGAVHCSVAPVDRGPPGTRTAVLL
jgi:hypothetical protein